MIFPKIPPFKEISMFYTKSDEIGIEPAMCNPHTERKRGNYRLKVHKCRILDIEVCNLLKILFKILQAVLFFPVMPACKKLSVEDHMFKASMRNKVKLCPKISIIVFVVL